MHFAKSRGRLIDSEQDDNNNSKRIGKKRGRSFDRLEDDFVTLQTKVKKLEDVIEMLQKEMTALKQWC